MGKRTEDERHGASGKQRGPGFWTAGRIAILLVFIFGIALGTYLTHFYVEPALSSGTAKQLEDCNSFRAALSEQLNSCLDCTERFGIEAEGCAQRQS